MCPAARLRSLLLLFAVSLSVVLSSLGCGGKEYGYDEAAFSDSGEAATSAEVAFGDGEFPEGTEGVATGAESSTPIERKIIYTADISTVVEDFDGMPEQVQELVEQHGGYIANSDLQSSSGRPRSGTWTIRVPAKDYGRFLDAACALGELQQRSEDSQEVTAEYYDVEARIRNKQREEERLLELLETATGKLQDVLQVEKELSRVREEIERYQGRMRVLQDQTTLSTVTLRIHELQGYQPIESPTFQTRIGRAWTMSLQALAGLGRGLVLAAVIVSPWIVVALPFILILILIIRIRRRRRVRNAECID